VQNGAEYHGDLTKNVTHLIAASPTGKKYEHAVNWRMKVVTWEWFEQSVQRGMSLDEGYYHPTMPIEERGRGAWERGQHTSPTLGKRTRDAGQSQALNFRRSKLRRSASSKMGSQSEALWAGITAVGLERPRRDEDDWMDEELTKTSLPRPNAPTSAATNDVRIAQDDAQPENPTTQSHGGIFEGRMIFAYAFDLEKVCYFFQRRF
jgi:DNA replication regulator DPB11